MTKVLFLFEPREELKTYLNQGIGNLENMHLVYPTGEQLKTGDIPGLGESDIIIGWRPTIELLQKAEKLSLFINPGAGVQHLIDMFREITKERKITLVNGHGNSYFTAQHGVALLLTLSNKIIPHHQWLHDGKWRTGDDDAISLPLRHRKIGLLGYGNINRKVHLFLGGFDPEFHVLRANPVRDETEDAEPYHLYSPDQLDNFLTAVDTLIIAVPLTRHTENLVQARHLELLGKDGLLINIGRGAVINEKDLYQALNTGTIAGAAIDVWYDAEPDPDEDGRKYPYHFPFHELDNIVLSPHRAASPFSDLKRWDEVVENITRFNRGEKKLINEVDLDKGY